MKALIRALSSAHQDAAVNCGRAARLEQLLDLGDIEDRAWVAGKIATRLQAAARELDGSVLARWASDRSPEQLRADAAGYEQLSAELWESEVMWDGLVGCPDPDPDIDIDIDIEETPHVLGDGPARGQADEDIA